MIGLQRAILYCYFYSRPCGRGDSEGEIVPAQSFLFLLTPLREGRPCLPRRRAQRTANFYSRPCGRGDKIAREYDEHRNVFLLTPLREGRLYRKPGRLPSRRYFYSRPCGRGDRLRSRTLSCTTLFLLTPLREGRRLRDLLRRARRMDFYSRPCGRGDAGERAEYPVPLHFYSRPCGRGDGRRSARCSLRRNFYSRPCGRGDWSGSWDSQSGGQFLLTPLREGRQMLATPCARDYRFLLTPLREGRHKLPVPLLRSAFDFYSRPCGRGDHLLADQRFTEALISTHAPAGGATVDGALDRKNLPNFYSRPCGRGDTGSSTAARYLENFYSRPCGRGDRKQKPGSSHYSISTHAPAGGATVADRDAGAACFQFLLTPLREGRRKVDVTVDGAKLFLLTPLREGRHGQQAHDRLYTDNFYSRPCGRGDTSPTSRASASSPNFYSRPCGRGDVGDVVYGFHGEKFLLTPLREGRHDLGRNGRDGGNISTHAPAGGATRFAAPVPILPSISTHAPAGGATAIFHKSVMRFCGKLPKDDTVLCLASFGFPRRDPKAVYLAWISCANLPQKCVREGLALKDQGTSCFHEGLASHAFDPVLV